ncbi:helix-turn-helix domain-containing protein [Enterococcus songbeiensis]
MITFERIKILAKKQGKSLNKVEEELGYGKNVLYRLKTTNPSAERLQELANYFNVSVDYLLGRTDDPTPVNVGHELAWDATITKEEEDLLAAFRLESEDMTKEEKQKFNNSLKGMMKIAKGLLDDDSKWKE